MVRPRNNVRKNTLERNTMTLKGFSQPRCMKKYITNDALIVAMNRLSQISQLPKLKFDCKTVIMVSNTNATKTPSSIETG